MCKKINSMFLIGLIVLCVNVYASDRGYLAVPTLSESNIDSMLQNYFPKTDEQRAVLLTKVLQVPQSALPETCEAEFIKKKEYRNNLVDALKAVSYKYKAYAWFRGGDDLDLVRQEDYKKKHALYNYLSSPLGDHERGLDNISDIHLYDCCCCWPTPNLPRLIFQLDRDIVKLKDMAINELQKIPSL